MKRSTGLYRVTIKPTHIDPCLELRPISKSGTDFGLVGPTSPYSTIWAVVAVFFSGSRRKERSRKRQRRFPTPA